MNITWIGQGGYLVEQNGWRLAIDPYLTDALATSHGLHRLAPPPVAIADLGAQAVFVTHDHLDHFDPETLGPWMQLSLACRLIGPQSVVDHGRRLGIEESRLELATIDAPMSLPGLRLTPTPAQHSDPAAVGLLIEGAGRTVYLSGDTLYHDALAPRILAILSGRRLDAALVCINGRLGNMNVEDAARFMAELRPGLAVPMHYGLFAENTADPNEFVMACRAREQATRVLELGETLSL